MRTARLRTSGENLFDFHGSLLSDVAGDKKGRNYLREPLYMIITKL